MKLVNQSKKVIGVILLAAVCTIFLLIATSPVSGMVQDSSPTADNQVRNDLSSEDSQEKTFEKSSFRFLDWTGLAIYLVAIVGIGIYFARKESSTDEYFLAGRKIPWWVATLSIFSTHLSAITFMAIPAKAYGDDWTTILVNLGIILVAPVTIFFFLPFYRRLEVTTIYEYLEKRFSPAIRLYGSLSFAALQLVKMGIFLVLPAIALSTVTQFDLYTSIIIMGLLCTVYTVMGGIAAVVWTDVIQSIVLLGGGLLCILTVIHSENYEFGKMWTQAMDADKLHIITLEGGLSSNAFWVIIIGGFFIQMIAFTSDQSLVQRFLTTPTERAASRSIWTHALMVVPASLLFFGLGTALYIFYSSHSDAVPPPEMGNDIIVPWFVVTQLPAGLAGIVIAGLFAATMSTVDSGMHSVATSLVNDVYQKIKPDADDKTKLKLARILTVLFGILGTLSAILISGISSQSLWTTFLMLVGLFGSSLAGVFALGVFTKKGNATGAVVGILSSILILLFIRNQDPSPVNGILTATIGTVSCFAAGYLTSLFFAHSNERSIDGLTIHTLDKLESPN